MKSSVLRLASAIPLTVPHHLRAALNLLRQAYDYAEDCESDLWDFAVEAGELRGLGLTTNDLRYLIRQGLAHQAAERTRPGSKQRIFGPVDAPVIAERSGFVLTAAGAELARILQREPILFEPDEVPCYDRELRELWLGDVQVKRFRRPAPLQHVILSSFQELGWPRRIDDPLPKQGGQEAKLRLRDSIKRLNQNQQKRVIRFRGGGRGLGITWELRRHR